MKWNRLYIFPIVAALALTLQACGEDGYGSTTGAGAGEINITGDSNTVCVVTADASDDNENITDNCGMNPAQAITPETDPGTSQGEDVPQFS